MNNTTKKSLVYVLGFTFFQEFFIIVCAGVCFKKLMPNCWPEWLYESCSSQQQKSFCRFMCSASLGFLNLDRLKWKSFICWEKREAVFGTEEKIER